MRADVDAAGYDVVCEARGVIRHILLKASKKGGRTSTQKINVRLAEKPSGCVVWIQFDPETLSLGPFLWLGGQPGRPLPELGAKIAKHTRANKDGVKGERKDVRVIAKGRFEVFPSMEAVVDRLFGE